MKRNFLKGAYSLLASSVLLFSGSCGLVNTETDGYDYSKELIEVTEVQQCAPCRVQEFLANNDYTIRQLYYALSSMQQQSSYFVKVDGVEWTRLEMATNELSEGLHEIYAYTSDDYCYKKTGENGVLQSVPYKRAITITVEVSMEYPDIYDYQYRIDNGLWLHPQEASWYEAYANKYLK